MRATSLIALVALFAGLGGGSHSEAAEETLPRYNLPLGRKLVYTASGESKPTQPGGSEMHTSGSWELTVVGENLDGSKRLILQSASSYGQKANGNEVKSERVQMGYADVFPDGRIKENPTLGMELDPSGIIPPLPKDPAELAKGWKNVDETRGRTNTFTAGSPAKDAIFTFIAVEEGVISRIYQTTLKTTFHFDTARGIIRSIDSENTQDYGFQSKGTSKAKLDSDTIIPADDAKTLAEEFERFFAVRQKYTELMGKVEQDPQNADATLVEAKKVIEAARDAARSNDVKKELASVLEKHDDYAKYAKESGDRFKDVLNKPAPDWSTTDVDGHASAMKDYRGKVVIMDFWYRGCGWCMYAMPQVKQLAIDYKDKPVVVLGMNTDEKEADARFVIDAFDLKYPTIKASGIPGKYGVQGFPTLIVVDQEGIVRDVHVGYSPDLREKVSTKINELLSGSQAP